MDRALSAEEWFARGLVVVVGVGLVLALVALSLVVFRRWRARVRAVVAALSAAALLCLSECVWRAYDGESAWFRPLYFLVSDFYWLQYGLSAGLAGVWAAVVVAAARRLRGRREWTTSVVRWAITAGLGLTAAAFAAEAYLKTSFVSKGGGPLALAQRSWEERYWKPINSQGFRDFEWPQSMADVAGRRLVFVVGDGYAAGGWVEDAADRLGNQLGARLGPEYVVLTIARTGWSTGDQLEFLKAFPLRPDIIVWQYLHNDADDLAAQVVPMPNPVPMPRGWLGMIRVHSHLVSYVENFVFSTSGVAERIRSSSRTFWEAASANPWVWEEQRKRLVQVVEYARSCRARLVVLTFTEFYDPGVAAPLHRQVNTFFRDQGVAVIDVMERVAGEDPATLGTNAYDSHPNPALHRRLAEMIYEELKRSP